MKLRMERHPRSDIVWYSGTHGCSDDDHEQDRRVRKYLADRVGEGHSRFLLDVRQLRVVFPSGMGDLLESWAPARDDGKGRLAILWSPSRKGWDRWAHLALGFTKAVETSVTAGVSPRGMRFFVDEEEARAFLLADESEATQDQA